MALKTLGDLKTRLVSRLNQPLGAGTQYLVSPTEAEDWAREAYVITCQELALLVDKYSITFTGVWAEYALTGSTTYGILGIKMVTYNNKGKPLVSTEQEWLMTDNPDSWNSTPGNPTQFYITDGLFSLIGFDRYPVSGDTAEVYYIYCPPVWAAGDSSVLLTPEQYNIAIVDYMYFYAKIKRGDKDALAAVANGTPAPSFWGLIEKTKQLKQVPDFRRKKIRAKGEEIDIYHC
jgi:hypothetical protein